MHDGDGDPDEPANSLAMSRHMFQSPDPSSHLLRTHLQSKPICCRTRLRTRTFVTNGLRRKLKLKELMLDFQSLRQKTMVEHKETVEWRYFAVVGEYPSFLLRCQNSAGKISRNRGVVTDDVRWPLASTTMATEMGSQWLAMYKNRGARTPPSARSSTSRDGFGNGLRCTRTEARHLHLPRPHQPALVFDDDTGLARTRQRRGRRLSVSATPFLLPSWLSSLFRRGRWVTTPVSASAGGHLMAFAFLLLLLLLESRTTISSQTFDGICFPYEFPCSAPSLAQQSPPSPDTHPAVDEPPAKTDNNHFCLPQCRRPSETATPPPHSLHNR